MRFDLDSYREVFDTITRNKTRSILTGFGVFWGLFMLLFMLGGGKGVKDLLAVNFDGFATNANIIVSNPTTKPYKGMKEGRRWRLTEKDILRLQLMIPELDVVTGMVSIWSTEGGALYGSQKADCNIKGVYPSYSAVEEPKIKYGRYLNSVDMEQERKVCVIGKRVYNDLFPEGGDPCGKFIKVGPIYYRIVGVDYNSGNISINGRSDMAVTIPISVARKIYNRGDVVDLVCMTGKKGAVMSELEPRIRQVVAREHSFDWKDSEALMCINTQQLFSLLDNMFKGVDFVIWLIGLGTILAGAIGVSNIMMVTVKERTTEIGIRRAIGATPRDILSQIIWESVLLTMMAGMLSIVFSVGVLAIADLAAAGKASMQISFTTAIVAALLISLLGVLAGLAPASRAMKIKPVDAMRDE